MSKSTLPPGFTTEAALKKAVSDYRTIGLGRDHTLRKIPGLTDHAYRRIVNQLEHGVVPPAPKVDAPPDLDALLIIAKRALRGDRQLTFAALRETLGVSDTVASDIAKKLEKSGAEWHGSFLQFKRPSFGSIRIDKLNAKEFTIGLVADTHLACRESRLDALHASYDKFSAAGITHVLHAGNLVDGYVPRINGASVIVSSIDDQTAYVVDNYPKRDGITTHFITGDDHEGWWQKEGFNWGFYMQSVAEREGRTDLRYLGHVEADVRIGGTIIKVQHPGGGSAYARSYAGQKQVEAFQSGEKPHILVQGHYHVSNYMVERGIHVIGMPGFQDQTIFARKKRLRMEVGSATLHVTADANGVPSRVGVYFDHYWDRGYYRDFLRSDTRLRAGKVEITP